MKKTFSFKLYRAKKNKKLHKRIEIGGEIYNHAIALHKCYYRVFKKHLNKYALQKHLTKLGKKDKYNHWHIVGSQAIQDITDRIERSYQQFYAKRKLKQKATPPRFKKKGNYRSITLKQAGYCFLEGRKVRIGKENYKYSKSREIEGRIKTVTIKRDLLGDIYLYISTETQEETQKKVMPDQIAGFDFGLKTFLTVSNGEKIISPEFFKDNLKEIARGHKKLSKKHKGSQNRKRERLKLCRLYKKVNNKRKDYHFKLAVSLCERYDLLCFETLDLKQMKKRYGRKISDLGFYQFLQILKHLCSKKGKEIEFLDPYDPTSKTCSKCLSINESLKLKERSWTCERCHKKHDRDLNAAINIKRQGIVLWMRKHKTCLQAAFA